MSEEREGGRKGMSEGGRAGGREEWREGIGRVPQHWLQAVRHARRCSARRVECSGFTVEVQGPVMMV